MNLTVDEIQRLKAVATAMRDRVITRAAANADAPPVVRESLSDIIGYCRAIERGCDHITTELARPDDQAKEQGA